MGVLDPRPDEQIADVAAHPAGRPPHRGACRSGRCCRRHRHRRRPSVAGHGNVRPARPRLGRRGPRRRTCPAVPAPASIGSSSTHLHAVWASCGGAPMHAGGSANRRSAGWPASTRFARLGRGCRPSRWRARVLGVHPHSRRDNRCRRVGCTAPRRVRRARLPVRPGNHWDVARSCSRRQRALMECPCSCRAARIASGPSTSKAISPVTSPSSPAPITASGGNRTALTETGHASCPRTSHRGRAGCRRRGEWASPSSRPARRQHAARLFEHAEDQVGPVDILVNNATGWVQDTFKPSSVDRFGRPMVPGQPDSIDRNLGVDARRERVAHRRVRTPPRRRGANVGPHHRTHVRWPARLS